MRRRTLGAYVAAVAAIAGVSCRGGALSISTATFSRAQKADVVCMQVYGADYPYNPITPIPSLLTSCTPAIPGRNPSSIPFHLYALVTQTTKGEVAVADLTSGGRTPVDIDRATPGVQFLPVGATPIDIAVTPDGQLTFVANAETNRAALFALPNTLILGDSIPPLVGQAPVVPPTLTSWPVCSLPQMPLSIAIVRAPSQGAGAPAYAVAVVLAPDSSASSQVVILDPLPFLRGAGLNASAGDVVGPGSLAPCPLLAPSSGVQLAGVTSLPSAWTPGSPWSDGVVYADAAAPSVPAPTAACAASAAGDGGISTIPFAPTASATPSGGNMLFDPDLNVVYVTDRVLPMIHVIDVSNPLAPVERPPLLTTSADEPTRAVVAGQIALSPTTRDYRRYLYAVDQTLGQGMMTDRTLAGGVMVFDVTTVPVNPTPPLTRPHPETNPLQPSDRLAFSSPVAAISFVRHDVPIVDSVVNGVKESLVAALTGLQCNANVNALASVNESTTNISPGAGSRYTNNAIVQMPDRGNYDPTLVANWPSRLRGVFAFVTLSNGDVVVVDVDDWDAPCRRPADMSEAVSSLAPAQIGPTSSTDYDPYHAPDGAQAVSDEVFFPVSAPHRPRSRVLFQNNSQFQSVPNLVGIPQALTGSSASLTDVSGTQRAVPMATNDATCLDSSTASGGVSTTNPPTRGVCLASEDPTVHISQTWTATYEGKLPNVDGLLGELSSDDYQTMTLTNTNALFCSLGVHDATVGQQRAAAAAIPNSTLASRVGDYVQITDQLLPSNDPYWAADNACWTINGTTYTGAQRFDLCQQSFPDLSTNLTTTTRDFPILNAFDDHLTLGTYVVGNAVSRNGITPQNRTIVGSDPSNVALFQLLQCCFHSQVGFTIRTGAEWVAVGSVTGYLHHVFADPTANNACVESCATNSALLNARAFEVPAASAAVDRNSPRAMRNPMFAFVMVADAPSDPTVYTNSQRDNLWQFSTTGRTANPYLALTISGGSRSINPQSSLFIPPLNQLAIVDGATSGLVLVSLDQSPLRTTGSVF